jgi:UDP-N-acetylmuramoylalanine--D-glutamate ligase
MMSLTVPANLASLFDVPVAVLGGGVSGRAVLGLLETVGAKGVIYDEKPGAGLVFDATHAASHRLVVFSPGFPVEHPWLLVAARAGCLALGELDFASLFWKGGVLAITGTNGKTTLTEFLTHALESVGVVAYATGNIGHSFSSLVTELGGGGAGTVAVCEVSSYQAETLWHFRTDGVLWTNFAEDHLERHPDLKTYFAAKYRLLALAPEARAFVGSSVRAHAERLGFGLPRGSSVGSEGLPQDSRLEGTVFATYPQRENFELALAWWRVQGLADAELFAAARSFHLGRHRLARVAVHAGVEWWNDSKATNFHAVEAALSSFPSPVHLIAGGKAKGGDIPAFVARIAPRVRHAYLIGETKEILARACADNRIACSLHETLDEAVAQAASSARSGDTVLLSPAFASFDMFRGYDHRGEVFESLVAGLGKS